MTISTIDGAQRKAARIAGFTCLLTMAIVALAHYGISGDLIVAGNNAETARNILAHETLFRVSIACYLVYGAGILVLLTALYEILKPVNRSLALLAAFFRLVYALTWVVVALNLLGVLQLLSGADYLRIFEADRLQALARANLDGSFNAYYVGLPFYGLASTVCSYLWFKSNYIPRGLAAWGVVSSFWCATSAFAFIIFPNFGTAVNLYTLDTPMATFELATSFWLLFKGLRPPLVE